MPYTRRGHRWPYKTAHALCMLDNYGYKHTNKICNTFCFSTATLVTRTPQYYVIHTLPVLFYLQAKRFFFFLWRCNPTRVMSSSFLRFLDHTQRRTTFDRTTLDEWSARRRDLYLTTHRTQNRQTSVPPVGFEPTISAGERPQTCALDRAATGTGKKRLEYTKL